MPSLKITLAISTLLLASLHSYAQGRLWGVTRLGGATDGGVIFTMDADGNGPVYTQAEMAADIDAGHPRDGMTLAANGKFYGVTLRSRQGGLLYEFDPTDNSYHTKLYFDVAPAGPMVSAANGKLYGLAQRPDAKGLVYEFDPSTGIFDEFVTLDLDVYRLTGGLIQASNGKIYGTTVGPAIFEIDIDSRSVSLKLLDDLIRATRLVEGLPGILYGISFPANHNDGAIFEYNINTDTYSTRHLFSWGTGIHPVGNLAIGANGKLYGVTDGFNNGGNPPEAPKVFEFDPVTNNYAVKASFTVTQARLSGLEAAPDGKLYGKISNDFTASTLFSYDPASMTLQDEYVFTLKDGVGYLGNVTPGTDGKLYGTSSDGGSYGRGTIFSFVPATHTFTKRIDFGFSQSPAFPTGRLAVAGNGKLYGMTMSGGQSGLGTLYEFDRVTGVYTIKHHFDGVNGATPLGGLTLAANGKLYGMTTFGGIPAEKFLSTQSLDTDDLISANGLGVLFEFDPTTATFSKLRNFDMATGCNPYGNLIQASNGKLYAITNQGGDSQGGVVFEYDLNGTYTVIHDLPGNTPGAERNRGPKGDLLEINGKLYGTTPGFGSDGGGTIFEVDIHSGVFTHRFDLASIAEGTASDSPGVHPIGSLTRATDGKVYGLSVRGLFDAWSVRNTIFEYDVLNNTVLTRVNFEAEIGLVASGPLTAAPNGKLYAATSYAHDGASSPETFVSYPGSIIEFDPATNTVKSKFKFNFSTGDEPSPGGLLWLPEKLEQTVALAGDQTKTYEDPTYTLPELSSGGLIISYFSSDPSVATVSGNSVTIVGAGTTTITGNQTGNEHYNAAPAASQLLTVLPKTQTILFDLEVPDKKVSDQVLFLNAEASSGLPIMFISSNPAIASINGNALEFHAIGNVVITAKQPGNRNYTAVEQSRSFEIVRGDQQILFSVFQNKVYGNESFNIDAQTSSGLPLQFESLNTNVATIEGNKVVIVGAGNATIVARQSGNVNYYPAAEVSRVLVVDKANQTINFPSVADNVLGIAPFNLQASATSGLPVAFSTTSKNAVISQNAIQLNAPGMVTVLASQPGNMNYHPANPVQRTFCVNPPKPAIAIDGLNLTSSSASGNNWYYGNEFIGSTSSIEVTSSGTYKLIVSIDGCASEASDDAHITVVVTDIEEKHASSISLYPSPASSKLFITISPTRRSRITVGKMNGTILHEGWYDNEIIEIPVESLPSGVYWIVINTGLSTEVRKFVRK